MRQLLIKFIRLYQVTISPDHSILGRATLGPRCRYQPTCSEYARQAIEAHGTWRGLWLTARRLGSCHPWAAGGYDPVPVVKSRQN